MESIPPMTITPHAPPAGAHGGDALRLARWLNQPIEEILDLSASLNPVAPDLGDVMRESARLIGWYPDAAPATGVLAAALDVDEDLVVLTNGGAEAIALVAQLEPAGSVVDPEFSLYRRHLRDVRPDAPEWRSNPSSPLGRLADPEATARVWDEAFYPLATGGWSRGDAGSWRIGSFTKLWACPGLRIGYVVAPDGDAAAAIRGIQPQWSVGAPALAAVEALAPTSDLPAWASAIGRLKQRLVAELRARGLGVEDTEACWVLVRRPGLREELAPHGVLVRDCATFGLPGVARVAVPDDAGREHLLAALDRVLG
jgi:histidinol-phosphate/aromatic aminotransferase/cobyric acid decarboxylase-like protein